MFLTRPNQAGAIGALMDEYARAAEDFCGVVEQVAPDRYVRTVDEGEPHALSIRAICGHVVGAAWRYSDYIRQARGLAIEESRPGADLARPTEVRAALRDAVHYTEAGLEGLYEADEAAIEAITFEVRWGPTYDPDMLLEHAVMHVLRHRRQILRWN